MIRAVIFWANFTFGTLFFFGLMTCFRMIFWMTGQTKSTDWMHWVGSLWGKYLMTTSPGWSIKYNGLEHLPASGEAAVLVANHRSMGDIFAVFSIGTSFRWLGKEEVFHYPVIGPAVRWCGGIPVKRNDLESRQMALQRSAEWLRSGVPMLFFPEGTRSSNSTLLPFKGGAFRLATDLAIPIIPIALQGTGEMLPKGSWIPGKAQVVVTVLPAMRSDPNESLTQFAERVRGSIVKELEKRC